MCTNLLIKVSSHPPTLLSDAIPGPVLKKQIPKYERRMEPRRSPIYKGETCPGGEWPAWGHWSLIDLLSTHQMPGAQPLCSGLAPARRLLAEAEVERGQGAAGQGARCWRAGMETPHLHTTYKVVFGKHVFYSSGESWIWSSPYHR